MKIITSIRRFKQAEAVVVVDVFRSSATICYGLRNGATEFRVVNKLADVLALAEKNDLKVGEKYAMRPKGFNFGNSPTEIVSEKIRGKRIVFSSTNLAHVLNSNRQRENVFVGTFCNAHALAKHLRKFRSIDFVACSSNLNDFLIRFEDLVGVGKILHEIKKFEKVEMDLLSKVCLFIYENFKTKSLLVCPTTYSTAIVGSLSDVQLSLKENNLNIIPACKYEKGFVGVKSI